MYIKTIIILVASTVLSLAAYAIGVSGFQKDFYAVGNDIIYDTIGWGNKDGVDVNIISVSKTPRNITSYYRTPIVESDKEIINKITDDVVIIRVCVDYWDGTDINKLTIKINNKTLSELTNHNYYDTWYELRTYKDRRRKIYETSWNIKSHQIADLYKIKAIASYSPETIPVEPAEDEVEVKNLNSPSNFKAVVFVPNNNSNTPRNDLFDGNTNNLVFDVNQVKEAYLPSAGSMHSPSMDVNIVFDQTSETLTGYNGNNNVLGVTDESFDEYGGGISVLYITMRAKKQGEFMGDGVYGKTGFNVADNTAGFLTLNPEDLMDIMMQLFGHKYFGNAIPIVINTEVIESKFANYNNSKKQELGNGWTVMDENEARNAAYCSTIVHEIGHALGIYNECSVETCVMLGNVDPPEQYVFTNISTYNLWDCTNIQAHQSNVKSYLRFI